MESNFNCNLQNLGTVTSISLCGNTGAPAPSSNCDRTAEILKSQPPGTASYSLNQDLDGVLKRRSRGITDNPADLDGQQLTSSWTVSHDSSSLPHLTFRGKANESWLMCRTYFRGLLQLVVAAPSVIMVPLLVLTVLLVAGEVGVWAAAYSRRIQMREEASASVRFAAQQLEFIFQSQAAPLVALASYVKQNPNIIDLNKQLQPLMAPLLQQLDTDSNALYFELWPWGICSGTYPPTHRNLGALNFNAMDSPMFKNIVRVGSAIGFEYAKRGRDFTIVIGPVRQATNESIFTFVSFIWLPVLNETEAAAVEAAAGNCNSASNGSSATVPKPWGYDQLFHAPYAPNVTLGNLTDPVCRSCGTFCAPKRVNGTLYQYWGYCNSAVLTSQLESVLQQLRNSDKIIRYDYVLFVVKETLTYDVPNVEDMMKDPGFQGHAGHVTNLTVVFGSGTNAPNVLERQPVCANVTADVLNVGFGLCISPPGGWVVEWKTPLYATVAVGALLVAVLDFALMVSLERHRRLVKAMLPAKVVRRLTAGRTYAQPFNTVTILFSDIVSYTNLSSELTPREVVDMLNMLYLQFDSLVDRHDLYKVETIGDAFMCVGGAPEPCHPKDAAIRVARMALDMIDCVREFTAAAGGRRIQIRVGMYTGDVVAAVMGKKMPHWCLVGDTVNVSSRMESSSRAMSVQIGATTADLLHGCDEFHLEARGAVDIKGKGRMFTYWLSRACDAAKATPADAPELPADGGGDGGIATSTLSGGSGGGGVSTKTGCISWGRITPNGGESSAGTGSSTACNVPHRLLLSDAEPLAPRSGRPDGGVIPQRGAPPEAQDQDRDTPRQQQDLQDEPQKLKQQQLAEGGQQLVRRQQQPSGGTGTEVDVEQQLQEAQQQQQQPSSRRRASLQVEAEAEGTWLPVKIQAGTPKPQPEPQPAIFVRLGDR